MGSEPLESVIREVWGFDTLRPMQAAAIGATLDGRDSLVVLPTGGGKSLCYQAPPLVTGSCTLVVSPLIALMEDQVRSLTAAGVEAAALHGQTADKDADRAWSMLGSGELRLLYTSPERALTWSFRQALRREAEAGRIRAVAIDEAHCISHWGHDFRPEYRRLTELRADVGSIPWQALTATATPQVRSDIADQLGLSDADVMVGDFRRPNLTYRVVRKHKPIEQIAAACQRHVGEGAIVYCISRAETERTAEALDKRGIKAKAYHAGLQARTRARVQEAFLSEELDVVCATVAFGMGIDRPNVRLVAHAAMPKSIEAYQQESGRAGRDGLPAECLLLYSAADAGRWRRLLDESAMNGDAMVLRAQLDQLKRMQRLATNLQCRHAQLLEHFGQDASELGPCGACDVCLGETREVPGSQTIARKVMSAVARLDQGYGAKHVGEVLRGRRTERVLQKGHDELSVFGLLRDHSTAEVSSFIDQLLEQSALEVMSDDLPVLQFGDAGREVLRGERDIRFSAVAASAERKPSKSGDQDLAPLGDEGRRLFETLKSLRTSIARENEVPAYVVFSDRTLRDMARQRPATSTDLLRCHGVGKAKLERFGEQFLEAIAGFEEDVAADSVSGSPAESG
ncbi:MAG: DNA helicase RecQ [Planctomycetota bacterium]